MTAAEAGKLSVPKHDTAPKTRIHRVKQIGPDGKTRDADAAFATFSHQPWAKRAIYRRLSNGYFCWEVNER